MKTINRKILYLLFLLTLLSTGSNFAQNMYSDGLYPLAVGNKWTYEYHHFLSQTRYRYSEEVTGVYYANAHRYFTIKISRIGYVVNTEYRRIDSVKGNIVQLINACPWLINEKALDSISGKVNDSFLYGCSSLCRVHDTTMMTVFGMYKRTKAIYIPGYQCNYYRVYVRDIGFFRQEGNCPSNQYSINLLGCRINGVVYGDTSIVGLVQFGAEVPVQYLLSQNYPNPFNPVTSIKFSIPQNETTHRVVSTRLIVYDALGREATVLVNQQLQPGTYEVSWDASSYPSGVYYYRLEAEDHLTSLSVTETKKMVLIK